MKDLERRHRGAESRLRQALRENELQAAESEE
jgi:hypothetical protein